MEIVYLNFPGFPHNYLSFCLNKSCDHSHLDSLQSVIQNKFLFSHVFTLSLFGRIMSLSQ